eukprot:352312-Chlamydomonas_euryale.AAC.20
MSCCSCLAAVSCCFLPAPNRRGWRRAGCGGARERRAARARRPAAACARRGASASAQAVAADAAGSAATPSSLLLTNNWGAARGLRARLCERPAQLSPPRRRRRSRWCPLVRRLAPRPRRRCARGNETSERARTGRSNANTPTPPPTSRLRRQRRNPIALREVVTHAPRRRLSARGASHGHPCGCGCGVGSVGRSL